MPRHTLRRTDLRTRRAVLTLHGLMVACVVRPGGGGGTSTTTDTGSTFIVAPDMGTVVECDPFAEMPCPDGQKCSAAGYNGHSFIWTGTPACFPILGDKQHGEPCDLGEGYADGLD